MIVTSTETVPDRDIVEILGVVKGNTVRARNVGRDITQSIRNIAGGELKSYSGLLSDARDQALDRMEDQAHQLDADAVLNVRFETSEIAQGSAEVLVYGTAVRLA